MSYLEAVEARRVIREQATVERRKEIEALTHEEIDVIVGERERRRTTLSNLTNRNKGLEKVADLLGNMGMSKPHEAIRYARKAAFGDEYDGLPLCALEDTMAKRGDALRLVYAYELLAPAIGHQLEAARRSHLENTIQVTAPSSAHECGGRSSMLDGNAGGDARVGETKL